MRQTSRRTFSRSFSSGGADPLHPDVFSYVGVFSSGLDPARDPDFEKRNASFLNSPEMLAKYGIRHQLRESPGGHTWINWRWLHDILPLMFNS
jgi:enterochelin esterase family protein